ncbi:hypothetical protein ACFL2B_03050 [Patescibacteria group bacterium]
MQTLIMCWATVILCLVFLGLLARKRIDSINDLGRLADYRKLLSLWQFVIGSQVIFFGIALLITIILQLTVVN